MLHVSKMYSIMIHQPTPLLALALSVFFLFFFFNKLLTDKVIRVLENILAAIAVVIEGKMEGALYISQKY